MLEPHSRFADDSGRRLFALALALGVLLQIPTLWAGFFADDYVHQLALREGFTDMPIPRWNLFDFGTAADWGTPGHLQAALPWWTSPDWKVRFFRPLSSASTVLDHALSGEHAFGYHVTSVLAWLALLVLTRKLYLALGLDGPTAALGVLILAVSDASAVPVGWVANRNALLGALFAVAAVLGALRQRWILAFVLALGAALCKESGAAAFLVVSCLSWWRGGPRSRWIACTGVVCFCAYTGALMACGYGAQCLFYATPWTEPGRFASNALLLFTGGLLSFLGPLPLDLALWMPGARAAFTWIGIGLGWPLLVWVARAIHGLCGAFPLAAWSVLFLLPQAGAVCADRLLFEPSIGVAGLLALFFAQARRASAGRARFERALLFVLFASATFASGAFLLIQNIGFADLARHVRERVLETDVGADDSGVRDVIVLQTENQVQGFALGATWHAFNEGRSVHFTCLQHGGRAVRWTRIDETSFELESLDGPFLDKPFEYVYVSNAVPPASGTTWTTPRLRVEAVDSSPLGLVRIRVELPRSLDDRSCVFVRPENGILKRLAAPRIGASMELERALSTRPLTP